MDFLFIIIWLFFFQLIFVGLIVSCEVVKKLENKDKNCYGNIIVCKLNLCLKFEDECFFGFVNYCVCLNFINFI